MTKKSRIILAVAACLQIPTGRETQAFDQSRVSSLPKAECGRQNAECKMASAECSTHRERSALGTPNSALVSIDLEGCLARAITNKSYQPPKPEQLTRAEALFRRTLQRDGNVAELGTNWAALGFELQEIATAKETLWLLSEPPGKEQGRGWYLFRIQSKASSLQSEVGESGATTLDSRFQTLDSGPQTSVALQAPHARNDLHTGKIALRLFLAGEARALAASTLTRHVADLAHLENSFFQSFTLAFAQTCPTGLVVQLHGFDGDKHDQIEADMIASAGTRSLQPWLGDWVEQMNQSRHALLKFSILQSPASSLKSNVAKDDATSLDLRLQRLDSALQTSDSWFRTLAFPRDTTKLGGTLNVQGRALRQSGQCRFLHLEMSLPLRARLAGPDATALGRALMDQLILAQPK
jgi:hypothetical protein